MGVAIDIKGCNVTITGCGMQGLKKPKEPLYLGNSGTTMRLIMGILSGQSFECVLKGDESLSARPMDRVTQPLESMGAEISGCEGCNYAPLTIKGGKLNPILYESPVPSAQVKSAILLAGLYAKGITTVKEEFKSRDHSERMLRLFGANVVVEGLSVSVKGPVKLKASDLFVPGDISSASFFIVGALLLPGSSVELRSVLYNLTRTGFIKVLEDMGADIDILKEDAQGFEKSCDIRVKSSTLKGVTITKDMIPSLIDEIPIIMVAASLAKGTTVIEGAAELRVKETDRIKSISTNLKLMGARVKIKGDDIIIDGIDRLKGAELESFGDHRTAMSMAIAALTAEGDSKIMDTECIDTSFPEFFHKLETLVRN